MDIPSLRRFLFPAAVGGLVVLGAAAAWDLGLGPLWAGIPVSAVAFLVYLAVVTLGGSLAIRRADRDTVVLQESVTRSLEDLKQAAEAYGRFVPIQFLKHLHRESITDVRLGDQVERTMTVLFSDIRNFTTLSENLSPQENFRFLNGYLGRIGPLIRENYGFIDKYIGDSVMALFDGPVDEALGAAVAMQLATAEYNNHLDPTAVPITVGVGLHSGPLMLGIIGEESRMESTVIADAVNLASRIESLTKHYDCHILVSRSTFEAQTDPQPYLTRPVDLVRVKGKSHSVELLEILDERFDARAALKTDLSARLAEAMMAYRRGLLQEAQTLFQTLTYRDPLDNIYSIYRKRIAELMRLGLPEGWDGTTVFDAK